MVNLTTSLKIYFLSPKRFFTYSKKLSGNHLQPSIK